MTMKYGFPAVLCSLLLLSGCASYMSGTINSVPDPSFVFDKNAPVLVVIGNDSEEQLLLKHFLPDTLTFLRGKGFRRVYTLDNLPKVGVEPKLFVAFSVNTITEVDEYTSADYGDVPTGSTTECTADQKGGTSTCTTKAIMSSKIIGYSKKKDYYTKHLLTLLMLNSDKKSVLEAYASYYGNRCPKEKIYRFLVNQTFQRIDLRSVVEQKFTVQMPDGTVCG